MNPSKKDNFLNENLLPQGIIKQKDSYISLKDLAKMVLVPEGEFTIGTDDEDIFAKEHEKPQRKVYLSAYLIDIFPVTNEQFSKFIEDSGYQNKEYWTGRGWAWKEEYKIAHPYAWEDERWNRPRQPVAGVSWFEAYAYAKWAEKILPTEAQWEKAARGTDARTYPWGEQLPYPELLNFHNIIGRTTEVDKYPKGVSPYGCYDMSGNVNNWCLDWYWDGFYRYCAKNNIHKDPALDDALKEKLGLNLDEKVDRGGGYATDMAYMRVLSCADKIHWKPETRNYWNGFRTVKNIRKK